MSALQRIRKLFSRSPPSQAAQPTGQNQGNRPERKYEEQMEILRDRAKGLCSDPWLANQIKISMTNQNGTYSFKASPEESLPYIRAANTILKDRMPGELSKHFKTP